MPGYTRSHFIKNGTCKSNHRFSVEGGAILSMGMVVPLKLLFSSSFKKLGRPMGFDADSPAAIFSPHRQMLVRGGYGVP